MGQHVFICYSSKDLAQATSVCELLERYGIASWMAHRNIQPGVTWAAAIVDAIDTASLILVLISTSANTSRHVAREIERADHKQIPIVPLRIENISPSSNLGYFIENVQWVDIFPAQIEAYWPKLSLAIGQKLGQIIPKKTDRVDLDPPSGHSSDVGTNGSAVGRTGKKYWFADNITAKTAGVLTGITLTIGAVTGVVSQVKSLKDGVCGLYPVWFCDGGDLASRQEQVEAVRLQSVGFDKAELTTLATAAKTPKVQEEARRRLGVIEAEMNRYEAVKDNITGLTEFLGRPCEACLVKADARNQLKQLKLNQAARKETESLQSAGFHENELKTLVRDAESPEVRGVAQDRLGVIEKEEQSLKSAAYDKTKLAPLASDAHSPQVQAEASNVLNMLEEIRRRLYELNFDPDRVDGQVNDLRQAIREFEKINKMAETGKPTAELLRRLREAGALQPWGAIVYACKDIVYACKDKKWGMSWSQDTRQAAVASARETCGTRERCPTEISFFGTGCGVFAHSNSSWSIVASDSIQQAKEKALSECRSKGGRSCHIVATVCADGAERYVYDKE